ncbi:MAG: hypothetical protein ACK452_03645, partial [Bacteroidota bacterium]
MVRFVNTIIFGVFFANTVFCQNDVLGKSIQEKSFHSLGTSVYLDIFNGPIREVKNTLTVTDPFGNTTTTTTFDYTRVS